MLFPSIWCGDPYGNRTEPNVPPKETVMQDFIRLSQIVGIDCAGWRYDPIFLDSTYTPQRHLSDFAQMCRTLAGYTRVCVISFIDLYEKVKRNFPEVRPVTDPERIFLCRNFVEIGRRYGITAKACGEGTDLTEYGADCATTPPFSDEVSMTVGSGLTDAAPNADAAIAAAQSTAAHLRILKEMYLADSSRI